MKASPTVIPADKDAEKNICETAFYESKPREIASIYCAEYSTLEASERRSVWHSYIRRAELEIIENSKLS